MSRREDIPPDVWYAARGVLAQLDGTTPDRVGGQVGSLSIVSRAIMAERAAERERCASIADAYEGDNADEFDRGFNAAAFRIARAIRGRS